MQTRYSVIVPVYNLEKEIGRCIDSILSQLCTDFELILVDDGSVDNSFAVCSSFAKRDSRVKLFRQENKGVSAARNTGIIQAEGEFVAFVDGDDYVSPNYLDVLDRSDADLVITGFRTENEYGNELLRTTYSPIRYSVSSKKLLREQFENHFFNNVYCKRFRRSILQKEKLLFDLDLSLGEDTCFTVAYLSYIDSIETVPGSDYTYVKYTSRETLTNQRISPETIDRLERSYSKIVKHLDNVLGPEAVPAVAFCIGKIYNSYMELYMNDSPLVDAKAISFLFRQYWFRQSLRDDRLYKNEHSKFRALLELRSGLLLIAYKLYRNKMKSIFIWKK